MGFDEGERLGVVVNDVVISIKRLENVIGLKSSFGVGRI